MSSHDTLALELSYKLLRRLNTEQLDEAYDLLLAKFGSPTKVSKMGVDNKSLDKKIIMIKFESLFENENNFTNPNIINNKPKKEIYKLLEKIVYCPTFFTVFISHMFKYECSINTCQKWLASNKIPEDIIKRLNFSAIFMNGIYLNDITEIDQYI